jgi:hypothetical protein
MSDTPLATEKPLVCECMDVPPWVRPHILFCDICFNNSSASPDMESELHVALGNLCLSDFLSVTRVAAWTDNPSDLAMVRESLGNTRGDRVGKTISITSS